MEYAAKKHSFQWPLLFHQHVHGHLKGRTLNEESNSCLSESGKDAAGSFEWSSMKVKNCRHKDKLFLPAY